MATATTAERAEPQAQSGVGQTNAATPRRAWISIDSGFATAVAVAALAFAAFAYLNTRVDNLGGRLDSVATELRTEIKRSAERTDDKIEKLNEKMDKLTERTDDKIDKLSDKIDKLSAETNDKFDRLTDKINELLINQSRAN